MYLHNLKRSLQKRVFGNELLSFKKHKAYLNNKNGLEIGGTSKIFTDNEAMPVYKIASNIDGCNFSLNTVWEGKIVKGKTYNFHQSKSNGIQFICEGNDLGEIKDESYDFVLSSHSLEHFANPLKAIYEWKRVTKNEGLIIIVLPHPKFTFDNKRKITTFKHLLLDYTNETKEDDLTHVEEVVEMHDYAMTPDINTKEDMRKRSLDNYNNRCLHHHVYNEDLIKEISSFFNLKLLATDFVKPFNSIFYLKVIH
ncbi:MAG: methyltransferase domain-containing protein [Chitinophagaceae bacterium]